MKITEIFDALEAGELSAQSALFDNDGLKPEHYRKFISHVNLGLIRLFERFDIQKKDCFVQMMDGIGEYHLTWEHARSNTESTAQKYVIDSVHDKFGDDVLKITEVYTEIGEELPINDDTEDKSVYTSGQNSLQIPWKVDGDVVNVVYRAAHKKLRYSDVNKIEEMEIYLPPSYLEPLLYFIAFRYFAGIGGQSATPTSQMYEQKFLTRCKEIELHGIPNQDQSASTNVDVQGWA